jgi:murein DD-endopeptidase MepM/ murein hydrolase activator NlpD
MGVAHLRPSFSHMSGQTVKAGERLKEGRMGVAHLRPSFSNGQGTQSKQGEEIGGSGDGG